MSWRFGASYVQASEPASGGGLTLTADTQTYGLTGSSVGFARALKLSTAVNNYVLAGGSAGLTYTPLSNSTLFTTPQTYNLSGQPATLTYTPSGVNLVATTGVYSLQAGAAALLKNAALQGVTQAYTLTGAASALQSARNLRGGVQTYSLAGVAATLAATRRTNSTVFAEQGVYTLAGQGVNFALRTKEYISFYGSQPNIPGDKVGFYD